MINKLEKVPIKILENLKKEYFKLIKGTNISVSYKFEFKVPVKVSWQEDVHASYVYEDNVIINNEQKIRVGIDQLVGGKTKKKLARLDRQIQRFLLKTKMAAAKYEVEDDDIWDYLWEKQAKAGL